MSGPFSGAPGEPASPNPLGASPSHAGSGPPAAAHDPTAEIRERTRRVRARALELFDLAGIAAVEPTGAFARYEAWLAAGRHGAMAWLETERHRARRADPNRVLPGVRAIVCVALAHDRALDPARAARLGRIARYAGGEDYHRVFREKLKALEAFALESIPGVRALGYADTGAILERAWAERAGLGWTGKHTGLISPRMGSWLLLGELLLDRDLEPDPPFALDHCGTCTRCIDACPTQAIVGPRQLDARRCISYLTIELRGPIPLELRPLIGDWIFGCDVCQEVCPWNRFAPEAAEARLHARALEGWTLERFLALDASGFEALFEGSPIRRARRGGFLRNVCVALGNRGEPSAIAPLARALAADPEPLVRAHAAWALGAVARQQPDRAAAAAHALRAAAAGDPDAAVREEANGALGAIPA
jgi:epoxyqueuosine reductase